MRMARRFIASADCELRAALLNVLVVGVIFRASEVVRINPACDRYAGRRWRGDCSGAIRVIAAVAGSVCILHDGPQIAPAFRQSHSAIMTIKIGQPVSRDEASVRGFRASPPEPLNARRCKSAIVLETLRFAFVEFGSLRLFRSLAWLSIDQSGINGASVNTAGALHTPDTLS
jgi:hypothetical protein